MFLNSGNTSFIRELLRNAAEKVAPVIDAFRNILAGILISVAIIIFLLLLIDWLIQRRKKKLKLRVEKIKEPLHRHEIPEVKKEKPIYVAPVIKEEIKIEEPVVPEEPPVVPEPKVKLLEEAKWFSLKEDVAELSSEFKIRCEQKNLTFLVELDDRLPEKINGRRNWLNDLIEQLFTNAIEQTIKGSITLKIKMVKRNDSTGLIQFLVTDAGIGLPGSLLKAVQEKNFSFHPGDETLNAILTRLHAVKWSVEKQGGRLTLASKGGEGSTIGMLLEFGA